MSKLDASIFVFYSGFLLGDGIWSKYWYQNVSKAIGLKPYVENSRIIPLKFIVK
tara:strand:- start:297 stop:458 length:162 start_codon:yes stop_codon:yes gene_type:complete